MALVLTGLILLAVSGFGLAFAALGNLILRKLSFRLASDSEHLLVATATGLLTTETFLFLIQTTRHTRAGCYALTILLLGVLLWEWKPLWRTLSHSLHRASAPTLLDKFLLTMTVIVALVEFLVSQAPLTGSDALNYHFAVQKLILQDGFRPIFSNTHSFLCGQHHLLILFGLALGSDHISLGFIFLGGMLTAVSTSLLISRWASSEVNITFVLLLLLTPVVFWQISVSGAPDIFMAFLACTAILVLTSAQHTPVWKLAAVAGFLVGGIAGAKYTGCLIAAGFLVAISLELQSVGQVFLFVFASLLSGIWPYFRNFLWTGNPLFPFLSEKLSPHLITHFAMADLAADTGATTSQTTLRLFPFVFLAAAQKNNAGLFDFFGPVVLALAPLILLAFDNNRAWRVSLLIWSINSVGIFYASGLPRFLLPVFPIALSCVAAGWEASGRRNWRIAQVTATVLIVATIILGGAGLAIYSARPLLAASGLLSKRLFLEQTAPDYQISEAINQLLAGQDPHTRTLLFIRHSYYLRIPYINGDPGTSFELDPEALRTKAAWKDFFDKHRIAYVVRAPDYPPAIAQPLLEMERAGDLLPFGEAEAQNYTGKRIAGERTAVQVLVFKVKPPGSLP